MNSILPTKQVSIYCLAQIFTYNRYIKEIFFLDHLTIVSLPFDLNLIGKEKGMRYIHTLFVYRVEV